MRDVLLGQAYYLRFDPKLWRAGQPFAPLGTLYAASYLRREGHTPQLFDAMMARSEREWASALDRIRPGLAVIYEDSFNYLSKMCLLRMRRAAETMIAAAATRRIPVVLSGSDATDHPEVYLKAGARAVVLGEGEVTLAELVSALETGAPLSCVAGLAFLDDRAQVVRSAARAFVKTLDDLPRPAWDLVDVPRYRRAWRRHGRFAMNLATTRGCPYHCNWCAKPIYGQRYAVRSPEAVVDEMAWLAGTYAPDELAFVDDVFGLQPGWIDRFASSLQTSRLSMPFRCLMRADQISEQTARTLASVGCRMVWMGAESGSQRILDAMEKGTTVTQIREAASRLRRAGVSVGLFLQFGYPGESWDDVQATLQLVRDVGPDDIGVSVSYPLPGTKFYERVHRELGQKQNWVDSSDLAVLYRATYEPDFYRLVHHIVHHEFRARQNAVRLAAAVGRPGSVRWADLRRAAAWIFHRTTLPLTAMRMRRMARRPGPRPQTSHLAPELTRAAASVPSPQERQA
ncbi:MAG: B12-binding domain-containing radical SAM protein [Acidobacteriota bacterium]